MSLPGDCMGIATTVLGALKLISVMVVRYSFHCLEVQLQKSSNLACSVNPLEDIRWGSSIIGYAVVE